MKKKQQTKDEIDREIGKLDVLIKKLESIEADALEVNKAIKESVDGDFDSNTKRALGLYGAEAKSNKAVKATGDLIGALTASQRKLIGERDGVDPGLWDADKSKTSHPHGTSDNPNADPGAKKVTATKTTADKKAGSKKTGGKKTGSKKTTTRKVAPKKTTGQPKK